MSRGKSKKNIFFSSADVGERIRQVRGDRTQEDFAKSVGILQGTLSKYERGATPAPAVLLEIARVGGTSVEWLLTGQAPTSAGSSPGGLWATLPWGSSLIQRQARSTTLEAPEPTPAPRPLQRRLPGLEDIPASGDAWAAFLAGLLRSLPGAPAVLSRHLAAALHELAATPWGRVSEALAAPLPLDLASDPATRVYALAAPVWCERWAQSESVVGRYFERAFPAGKRVLEIGAGCGRDLARLLEQGYDAWGVEASEAVRREAERRHPGLADRLKQGAVPGLGGLFDGSFDGILCANVFQEVPDNQILPAALELCALLRPGGRLLLSVPLQDLPADAEAGQPPFHRVPPDGLAFLLRCLGFTLLDRWESPGLPGHPVTLLFEMAGAEDAIQSKGVVVQK